MLELPGTGGSGGSNPVSFPRCLGVAYQASQEPYTALAQVVVKFWRSGCSETPSGNAALCAFHNHREEMEAAEVDPGRWDSSVSSLPIP
ncbi:hypothetical protein A6R68_23627 [Neotoma lepida]|uniref:Uncharacterized protein n=1 Tax=Neotoma lepida TaxID=56216 RepID=A0A1A6HVZ1_NEOLE|nr:hypothetical protein A6R68_23627 [Neotoma lepida]